MEKYDNYEIGGSIVKRDERYQVFDNPLLKNLILSKTILEPQQATSGHSHAGQEEVYIFTGGSGIMIIDNIRRPVVEGSIVLIEDGEFHKVLNNSETDKLTFVCVFDGKRDPRTTNYGPSNPSQR